MYCERGIFCSNTQTALGGPPKEKPSQAIAKACLDLQFDSEGKPFNISDQVGSSAPLVCMASPVFIVINFEVVPTVLSGAKEHGVQRRSPTSS